MLLVSLQCYVNFDLHARQIFMGDTEIFRFWFQWYRFYKKGVVGLLDVKLPPRVDDMFFFSYTTNCSFRFALKKRTEMFTKRRNKRKRITRSKDLEE